MSETSSNANTQAAKEAPNPNDIEDLLRQLHGQIKSSDWIQENQNRMEKENPELIKAWKNAIDDDKA